MAGDGKCNPHASMDCRCELLSCGICQIAEMRDIITNARELAFNKVCGSGDHTYFMGNKLTSFCCCLNAESAGEGSSGARTKPLASTDSAGTPSLPGGSPVRAASAVARQPSMPAAGTSGCSASTPGGGKEVLAGFGECAICLDVMRLDQQRLALPCGHLYHEHCVAEWLARASRCPECDVSVR